MGLTRAALELGIPVHFIPPAQAVGPDEEVLGELAPVESPAPAVWLGSIPTPERYARVYEAANARGLRLVSSPEEHLRVIEFPRAWPYLEGLSPESRVLDSPDQVEEAVAALGLPVFIKGTVLSRKHYGWKSCVAESSQEARVLVEKLLRTPLFSRQRVVLRRFAPLRRTGSFLEGFPCSREYRLFLLRGEVVGEGYYWPFDDPFGEPGAEDRAQVHALVKEAARRLAVPFLAVDVAQLESGQWVIIETGDPQFAGLSHIAPRPLLERIREVLATD